MSDSKWTSFGERNVKQAITALKRGSCLLKYGRRGKPKFCPFRLSNDETTLIWFVGKKEKQLQLSYVSKIISGQRTEIFQRYPRPEKDYLSFSLIYANRSLDVICKERDEAEIWLLALSTLISRNNGRSSERRRHVSYNSSTFSERDSQSLQESSNNQTVLTPVERTPQKRLGRAFSDIFLYSEAAHYSPKGNNITKPRTSQSSGGLDELNYRSSADTIRLSLSSAASSSSPVSLLEELDTLADVLIWGEGVGEGLLGGGMHSIEKSSSARMDALLPRTLESTTVLDARKISCGSRHAVLVTKQGEIFSWGEGSDGRLGHGLEAEVSSPKLIHALGGLNIESVACGEYHTSAITVSGDLYTWGDGIHNFGLLGHGTEISHWIPKKLGGQMDGMHISFISCGPWHSAAITSAGLLFTFGDGTFGALGHGNRNSTCVPREVEILKGLRTVGVSCGVWHTAAIVDTVSEVPSSEISRSGKLFTWGDGDKGQLGHGDKKPRLNPVSVSMLDDKSFCQVACGHSMTIALSSSGQVYTMGSAHRGQHGSYGSADNLPKCIEGKMSNNIIEEIACGSHHFAVLSSKSEVYTWGKGTNGQLGHGDFDDRNTPTLVEALLDRQVKSLACGSNFTVAICLHKRVCTADQFVCSGCQNPFNFRRKRHNCYNCGMGFCKACSCRRSLRASLAPNLDKPFRVCEDCYFKLNKDAEISSRPPKVIRGHVSCKSSEVVNDQKTSDQKLRGFLSRLSSFDSFRRADIRSFKENRKHDSNNCHLSPSQNESTQREGSSIFSSPSVSEYSERVSPPITSSVVDSLATSPLSSRSSPYRSISLASSASLAYPEVLDDTKRTNDNLTKEISILREQVEALAQRSQLLEAELERTSRQLKEATKLAREEEEKKKAAKDVIKSLTTQLNEMAAAVHQGSSFCQLPGSYSESTSNSLSFTTSTWSQLTS